MYMFLPFSYKRSAAPRTLSNSSSMKFALMIFDRLTLLSAASSLFAIAPAGISKEKKATFLPLFIILSIIEMPNAVFPIDGRAATIM